MLPFLKLTTSTLRKPDILGLKISSKTSSNSFANFINSSDEGSVNASVNSMFWIVSVALQVLPGVGLVGFSGPLVGITFLVDSRYIDVVEDNEEEDDTNFVSGAVEDDGDRAEGGRDCRSERGNDDDDEKDDRAEIDIIDDGDADSDDDDDDEGEEEEEEEDGDDEEIGSDEDIDNDDDDEEE